MTTHRLNWIETNNPLDVDLYAETPVGTFTVDVLEKGVFHLAFEGIILDYFDNFETLNLRAVAHMEKVLRDA